MQEEVTQRTVALCVEATKLSAGMLQQAMKKVLDEMQKGVTGHKTKLHHGKQTLRQLMKHNTGVSNIEITDQNIRAFSATAKKYGIDFALKKDTSGEIPRYLVFFKGRDADVITAAFREFSAKNLEKEKKFCNHYSPCQKAWAAGKRVVKFIGYDAGEGYRSDKVLLGDLADRKYSKWYPLMEWGWTRDDCIRQIEAAGLPQPGKSSCFFCPSMKPDEITALREQHPDLFRRALALEDNARQNLKTVKGLGRNYSWRERFGKEFCTHGNG